MTPEERDALFLLSKEDLVAKIKTCSPEDKPELRKQAVRRGDPELLDLTSDFKPPQTEAEKNPELKDEISLLAYLEKQINERKTDLNHQIVAETISKYLNAICYIPSDKVREIWRYDKSTGLYVRDAGECERLIMKTMKRAGLVASESGIVRDILRIIKNLNQEKSGYPFNQHKTICLKNGVILFTESGNYVFVQHSPKFKHTIQLPITYNENANIKVAETILKQWLGEESVKSRIQKYNEKTGELETTENPEYFYKMLVQIPAQSLYQAMFKQTLKRSYILVGDGNNGKSAYIDSLKSFFGKDLLAGKSLQALSTDRFVTGSLENKYLNVYDDLRNVSLTDTGKLKDLTGAIIGHDIEKKCHQSHIGEIFCTHVFSCNIPPHLPDSCRYEPAFWERWNYVKFPFVFKTDPGWYGRNITKEYFESFLILVLNELKHIIKTGDLTIRQEPEEIKEMWFSESDPLKAFVDEFFIASDMAYDYNTDEMLKLYETFFTDGQYDARLKITTKNKLTRSLLVYGFEILQKNIVNKETKLVSRPRVYRGKLVLKYDVEEDVRSRLTKIITDLNDYSKKDE